MESNVAQLLSRAAQTRPEATALVDVAGGRRVGFAELDELTDRCTTGLAQAGIRAGQRVMLVVGNRVEFVAGYLGALRARAVAVPVNPRSAVGELQRMIADSGARMVLADADTVTDVRAALAELPEDATAPQVVVVGADAGSGELPWDDLVAEAGRPTPLPDDPEGLAVLLYTSGTSGRPRAAMLSHRALLANIDQVARIEPPVFHEGDVVLGVLPLFHVYALNAVLGQVLRQGNTLVLLDAFDPEGTLDVIATERVDVVPVAPPVFAYWRTLSGLRERLASVRVMLSGSAPLAPELVTEFQRLSGVEVHQGYGLTEAAPVVTSTLCSQRLQSGSVGAAVPGVELRLVDDAGREPEGDDPGEIHVRGDNLFSGYWPEGPDGRSGPDADGWWATGDVGFLDASGDLFLVDRVKELIIVSGFNVYPTEIEEVIGEVDGVGGVAVIGVPDEKTGEAVVAYVVPRAGETATPEELVERVQQHCASRLARFKQPSSVVAVDELPYGATGKVQKGRLRAAVRRASLGLLE